MANSKVSKAMNIEKRTYQYVGGVLLVGLLGTGLGIGAGHYIGNRTGNWLMERQSKSKAEANFTLAEKNAMQDLTLLSQKIGEFVASNSKSNARMAKVGALLETARAKQDTASLAEAKREATAIGVEMGNRVAKAAFVENQIQKLRTSPSFKTALTKYKKYRDPTIPKRGKYYGRIAGGILLGGAGAVGGYRRVRGKKRTKPRPRAPRRKP